jgi:hypothetical protein
VPLARLQHPLGPLQFLGQAFHVGEHGLVFRGENLVMKVVQGIVGHPGSFGSAEEFQWRSQVFFF